MTWTVDEQLALTATQAVAAIQTDRLKATEYIATLLARAAALSTVAVTCGTPSPSTPREVQAAPGPTPMRTPETPFSISSRTTL